VPRLYAGGGVNIRITGTPEEVADLLDRIRPVLGSHQTGAFIPREDGSRLGELVVVTCIGGEEA
jgi:hypothetical protein